MSVTATTCGTRETTGNRNADPWAAWWDASSCGRCGAELTGTVCRLEQRYMVRQKFGPWGPVPVCRSCFEHRCGHMVSPWAFTAPSSCEACGRPVVSRERRNRLYIYCSERCARRLYNRHRSEKRARARRSTCCSACGEQMSPSRSDARYCSNACRQRAYRERKGLAARRQNGRSAPETQGIPNPARGCNDMHANHMEVDLTPTCPVEAGS